MARNNKKKAPLKERNPYKYYRNGYYGCISGEWACLLTPIAVIFGTKWNEYMAADSGNGGVKLTIGSMLALVMAAIIIYKQVRHQEKMNKKVTMFSYTVGIGVAFILSYLFKVILDDLTLILGSEFAGACAAYGFDLGASNRVTYMNSYRDEMIREKARKASRSQESEAVE